ncbi:hypothetical protein DFJ74DRAFT_700802 [Hyaloraphidium curvatum]|nr:hypothetical protein DFJ74DRAFT_700802 [Hyaloraphidium curvatum]
MTDEEVNELMTDPDAFQSFFLSLDPVKSMNAVSKELRQGNELLARKTLAKEEDLRQLQSTVREKLEEMRRAKAELEKVAKEKETLLARYSPQALVGQLASLAHTSDMESESIAEAFIAGVKSTEDFLKEFREERRLYHLRSGKAERARGSNLGS